MAVKLPETPFSDSSMKCIGLISAIQCRASIAATRQYCQSDGHEVRVK